MSETGGLEDPIARLLGLAFAGADLLFEVDRHGQITFALGAADNVTGTSDRDLIGQDWTAIFAPEEADLLSELLTGIRGGERKGPLKVALRHQGRGARAQFGSLSAFRLPQRSQYLSCALSRGGQPGLEGLELDENGLVTAESFEEATAILLAQADEAGLKLDLDLVELTGLNTGLGHMGADAATAARRVLAATLRAESYGGLGGSELARDRFALIRPAGSPASHLADRMETATGERLSAKTQKLPLESGSVAQNIRAMRHTLNRYSEDGAEAAAVGFREAVAQTLRQASRFKTIVATGDFTLAFQPVVILRDQTLHHFEALARFGKDGNPGETIRLAEDMQLITAFDLAVVKSVAEVLKAEPFTTRIAANISAKSLMIPSFIEALLEVTSRERNMRPRLMLEITETSQIGDLEQANRVLADLRKKGHIICLDDFGAGAASLDYLRQIEVDYVKIDGRYIQDMRADTRGEAIVRHVVRLCEDLGMSTIAEMIETEDSIALTRQLGVTMGQGWAFSRALEHPRWAGRDTSHSASARRAGAQEEWG